MSWFSKHVVPKFKKLKTRDVLKGAAVAGGVGLAATAIGAGIKSLSHAARTARDQVRRIAEEEGISEVEAAARLADRLDKTASGADFLERNRGPLLIVAAIGVVLLVLFLARRR